MEDKDLYQRYREFLKEQGYKRLSDLVAKEVAAMGVERFAEAIKRYLQDSPELAQRIVEMVPELQEAALKVVSAEKAARAAAEKDAVVTAVTGLAALKIAPEKIAELLTGQGHKVTVEQIRQILGQAK